jgi:hypothetical protein
MCDTPVEVITSAGCLNYPCRTPMKGLAAIVALSAVALNATGARATGDTWLHGFVWREASCIDHVRVTPKTRSEARADNAAALSRINPNGGAFGRFPACKASSGAKPSMATPSALPRKRERRPLPTTRRPRDGWLL